MLATDARIAVVQRSHQLGSVVDLARASPGPDEDKGERPTSHGLFTGCLAEAELNSCLREQLLSAVERGSRDGRTRMLAQKSAAKPASDSPSDVASRNATID